MREKGYHILWVVLPLIGLALWGSYGITENLWYDEAYSAALVTHTPWEIVRITAGDVHSPFYYFLLKIVWEIFGSVMGFRCLKWFSILTMTGYMLLGKYYGKKLFGEKISVWFMFFSVVMPIMLVQSGTVRMYALALFFMTLADLLMVDLFREPSGQKWLLFIFASVCSVYSHTYAMLQMVFLYLIFLGVILYKKKYELLKGFVASSVTVSVLFLPWLLVVFLQLRQRSGGAMAADMWQMVFTTMRDCFTEWFTALEKPVPAVRMTEIILCLFLCCNGVRWMKQRKNYIPALGMLAMALTIGASLLVYIFTGQGFFGRVFFPGFASLMFLYAAGMDQLRSRLLRGAVIAAAVVSILVQHRSELELEYDSGLGIWRDFVSENVQENDAVMAPNVHTLYLGVFCPETDFMIYVYLPGNSPFYAETFTDWPQLDRFARHEGTLWYVCPTGETPDRLAERYTWEEKLNFHYMYQDFAVFRLAPISL